MHFFIKKNPVIVKKTAEEIIRAVSIRRWLFSHHSITHTGVISYMLLMYSNNRLLMQYWETCHCAVCRLWSAGRGNYVTSAFSHTNSILFTVNVTCSRLPRQLKDRPQLSARCRSHTHTHASSRSSWNSEAFKTAGRTATAAEPSARAALPHWTSEVSRNLLSGP